MNPNKNMKNEIPFNEKKSLIENLKNPKIKSKFLEGINKLGFPLEFKIRAQLNKKGYKNVQEGFFTHIDENKQEITKTYDISAHKDKSEKILNNLTINLGLQLVGDCKFSSDNGKFLFAIPDTSNLRNKKFIGPLLTNLQSVGRRYRNSEVASMFLSEFGDIPISSKIEDTSENHIIKKKRKEDETTGYYEKIFNIVENTILPAFKEKFIRWRQVAYDNYSRQIKEKSSETSIDRFIESQKRGYFSGKLIIPFIVTSKSIIKPITNEQEEIIDIEEIKFTLYEHSVKNLNNYLEILDNLYNLGIFVCNERYFDEFIVYIENLFEKIFKEIIEGINCDPTRLIGDFEDIEKQNMEMQQRIGKGFLFLSN